MTAHEAPYLIDPAELSRDLAEVRDYCRAKRGSRPMPRRADIDPFELRAHLPFLSFIEPVAMGTEFDFRFRLLGTGITERMGRDSTGRTLREVYASARPHVLKWMLDAYTAIVTLKRPVYHRGTLGVVNKKFVSFEAIHMPLSEDGEQVSLLFGRTHFIAAKP